MKNTKKSPDMPTIEMYKSKPSLSLTENDLPEIENWKVGDTYKIELTVKQTYASVGNEYESSEDESKPEKAPIRARFEILSAKSLSDSKTKIDRLTMSAHLKRKASQY